MAVKEMDGSPGGAVKVKFVCSGGYGVKINYVSSEI